MESQLIHWLRNRLSGHRSLLLGPGDDAAILQLSGDYAATTDMLTDGVDFHLEDCDPRRIGRKSLAVNLSDLAAMGAQPTAALVSLALPRKDALALAQSLFEGMLPLAEEFNIVIAGGDTNSWDGPLAISITALGEITPHGALRRDGAKPGDAILVTGSFGGSILGKHFDFQPRVQEALLLNQRYTIHAATDVSDGLSLDLSHIATESGCGAEIDLTKIPIAEDAQKLADKNPSQGSASEHALSDGEDFELILAVPPDAAQQILSKQILDTPLTQIGQFIEQPGLWQLTPDNTRTALKPRGYQH